MHLQSFLLIVVSLSCGSLSSLGETVSVDWPRAFIATLGIITAWWIVNHVAARSLSLHVKSDRIEPIVAARLLEKQLDIFRWLSLPVIVLCLGGFGIARGLADLQNEPSSWFAHSMLLQSLVLLTPGLFFAAASWSAEHRYGAILGYTDRGVTNHFKAILYGLRSTVGLLVVPILVLFAIGDCVAALPITNVHAGWLMAALSIVFVCLGIPWLASRVFATRSLDPDDACWIQSLLDEVNLHRTKAVVWDTNGRCFNAMISGFVPPFRTLLLSDRLIQQMPRPQVAMVVLHEAAHLRRRHVPIRMLSVLPAWGVGALVTHYAGERSWAMALGSVVAIALTMLILRLVAYRTEYDADVTACRFAVQIASQVEFVPKTIEDAAETMANALVSVTADQPATRKPTWLHPGVDDRVRFLRRRLTKPQSNNAVAGAIANPA